MEKKQRSCDNECRFTPNTLGSIMIFKVRPILLSLILFNSSLVFAQVPTALMEASSKATSFPDEGEKNWLDRQHTSAKQALQEAANDMNAWFDPSDTSHRAKATVRVIIDNHWDKHQGYSIKPRIRGQLKLPALEERLHVVFGDESLDNELRDAADITLESLVEPQEKTLDFRHTRRDNASLGLQWQLPQKKKEKTVDTKLSLGIRSRGDIYAKAKLGKTWSMANDLQAYAELIYRYGIKSKNYARANVAFTQQVAPSEPLTSSQWRVEYAHNETENWNWGHALSRKHPTSKNSWFNYGFYLGGYFENSGQFYLNSYGPFVGFRRPLYSDWLFIQPELTYYNDKKKDRKHHVGVMIRLESEF